MFGFFTADYQFSCEIPFSFPLRRPYFHVHPDSRPIYHYLFSSTFPVVQGCYFQFFQLLRMSFSDSIISQTDRGWISSPLCGCSLVARLLASVSLWRYRRIQATNFFILTQDEKRRLTVSIPSSTAMAKFRIFFLVSGSLSGIPVVVTGCFHQASEPCQRNCGPFNHRSYSVISPTARPRDACYLVHSCCYDRCRELDPGYRDLLKRC